MWADPWFLVLGLTGLLVVGSGVATAVVAFPAGVMWNRRRASRVAEFEAAFAAGLEQGRSEPRPVPNIATHWTPSQQVCRTPAPAGLFAPQQPTAPALAPVKSHADPTRTRVSTTVGKRWKPGTQHTTAMPAVTPDAEQVT